MSKVLIIPECGHNHFGNIELAKLMIEEAKNCGAEIVKFQLYDTNKIKKFYQSRYAELKFSELTFEDVKKLKEHCDKVGIEFMASAFDIERVRWLEELGVKRHKIASRSIRDEELIKAMERTKKPIIASLGNWNDIILPKIKKAQFLYCISEYPAYIVEGQFPNSFNNNGIVGFSDHTIGCYWAREAIKRGAIIIEKHFTLDKKLPGHDMKGSMEPYELRDLITYAKQIERGVSF